jgi:hypothetical protein
MDQAVVIMRPCGGHGVWCQLSWRIAANEFNCNEKATCLGSLILRSRISSHSGRC